MSDSVIPSLTVEDLAPPSAAVVALRKEVSLAQNAVFAIGELTIKAKEAGQAHELMLYLDAHASAKIKELDSLIATELLQRPVTVDGSKLTVADSH